MTEDTWQRLQAQFDEFPISAAGPVTDEEIDAVSQELGRPLPPDFREFLRRYGGAVVGPYPIYGLRVAEEIMPEGDTLLEMNARYRDDQWPGVEDWLVFSSDHAGNPWGIAPDGRVWVSDHDFGGVQLEADSFEDFLRRICLKLPK